MPELTESRNTKILTEQDSEGVMRLHFAFMNAGIPTGNGRTYKASTLKSAVQVFNKKLAHNKISAYGAAGHPKSDMQVGDVATEIESLEFDDKTNIVSANVKLLDTRAGRDVKAIIRGGGQLGVSARGYGSVHNENGKEIVSDDYSIAGVDFCLAPSVEGAWVGKQHILGESASIDLDEEIENLDERYLNAVRLAGWRGTKEEYKNVILSRRREEEAASSPVPLPGLEDPDLVGDSIARDLYEGAMAKFGPNVRIIENDGKEIILFDLNTSSFIAAKYQVENGAVTFSEVERI